jgi:hypothetical protein
MHDGRMVATVRSVRVFPLLRWLVAILAVSVAVLVWASFAQRISNATPVPVASVPQPNAVVWDRRVYQSQQALVRDLERAGKSYPIWARNHPGAAALLASLEHTRAKSPRPTG